MVLEGKRSLLLETIFLMLLYWESVKALSSFYIVPPITVSSELQMVQFCHILEKFMHLS